MKAQVAAGIIAWSILLNIPFICREIYRAHFQKPPVEQKEGALEQKVADDTVKIKLPWKKHRDVVDCCSGISPFRGICFFMKDDTRITYKFDKASEQYLNKSLELLKIMEHDDLYSLYVHIDKNKDMIIDGYEAKGLYNASLLARK